MKALTAVDQRLRSLKTAQTSEQLADYLAISIFTTRKALQQLREMGEVRRFSAGGRWYYEIKRVPTV